MRGWTEYHGLQASATRRSFVIETMSAPAADGWYQDRGLPRSYLLGG